MFENLSERLERSFKILKGEGKITEINVAETLKDVRRALLDADVNYRVAKNFTDRVKQKALGMNVLTAVKPGQLMVKLVHDELAELMGGEAVGLKLENRPAIILMSGLQGSGKTTFSGKLANMLKTKQHRRPLLVACDVYRPAAIQQLHVVGEQVGVPVWSEPESKDVVTIAQHAIQEAKQKSYDTVIVDTVKYKSLIPGQTYTLEGELMNRETDKSTGVTATTEFTPESASGEVKLEFTVDTSKLKGHTLVAFETLKMDTDGKETTVAEHKDIKDEAQSVHIPKVKTTAGDEKTGKKNITSGTVVDVVEYTNLVPGLKYTVEGVLMDKKTGKSTGITAKGSFTPKKANGKVKLKFKLNNKVNGKTLVVFETLKLNGKVVGEHKDINDKAQTVTVKKGTLGSPGKSGAPKTGQSIPWILVSLGILIALAGTYVIRNRRELFHK